MSALGRSLPIVLDGTLGLAARQLSKNGYRKLCITIALHLKPRVHCHYFIA